MSATTLVTPLATYRNETPYPFCPGCGHGLILDQLNQALVKLGVDPAKVVLVSDIGCSGLSDQYFGTSAFHGLHGRSVTYASGIKLARPDLKVVVIMGDGGTGIGGTHLLNAARRNLGLTVLVFNNLNFGMTGGQHSTTTPAGAITATTRGGNLERPLDVCASVAVNGAGYVYRGTSWDKDLADRIAEAIAGETFALFDIWELCTAYYVPNNHSSRKDLLATLDGLGFATGILAHRQAPEYAAAYRAVHREERGLPVLPPRPLEAAFQARLDRPFRLVLAGSAGGRVRTSARLLAQAAVLSGLWAAQRDDYPITVKTGHSLSELILSPEEILDTNVTKPDALLLLTAEGAKKCGRYLAAMEPTDRVFALPDLTYARTAAQVTVIDPGPAGKDSLALTAATTVLEHLGLFPVQALEAAIHLRVARGGEATIGSLS
jgi:pyruvate/2-oxoacid:ferredoxin oxidoreductase beta subunit